MKFTKFYSDFFLQFGAYLKALRERISADMKSMTEKGRRRMQLGLLWLLALLIVVNPLNGALSTSVGNQEFFTVHLRDIARGLTGSSFGQSSDEYYLATGTYEKQLDGPLFGAAKDKNLIVIQVEALQDIMLNAKYNGQELTPNLNRLLREQGTIYFDHYYQMLGSGNTSDSEFVTNNSYMGSIESYTYQLYQDNYFKGLPWILKENGYSTAVFHGFDKTFWNRENIYPNLGFDQFINSDVLENDNIVGISGGNIVGISDQAFFEQSMEYIKSLPQPFYSFMITLSSHHPFKLPAELSEIQLEKRDQGTLFGDYINSVHYADKCLGMFLDQLKEEGLYDDTMIAVYGDHFGLPATDDEVQKRVSEFLGRDYKLNDMMNIPLVLHVPGTNVNETISLAAGQVDFLPTVSYLLGIPELPTLYFGQNLLTAAEGFVWEQTHLLKGSFITDDVVFEMARDGVISHSKAWNVDTGEEVDSSQYEPLSLRAKLLTELSDFYLKNDVLRKALQEGMTMEEIISGVKVEVKKPETVYAVRPENLDTDFDALFKEEEEPILLVNATQNYLGEEAKLYVSDIIELMEKYDNIRFMIETGEDPISILRDLKQINVNTDVHEEVLMRENLLSRAIPIIHNFDMYTKTEYEGFKNIIVVPEEGAYTTAEMQAFLNQNKPFAMMIDVSTADDPALAYMLGKKEVFTYGLNAGVMQRDKLKKAGFNGFISALPR